MSLNKQTEFLDTAVSAARGAGKIILDNLGKISQVDIGLKQASDFVTTVSNARSLSIFTSRLLSASFSG